MSLRLFPLIPSDRLSGDQNMTAVALVMGITNVALGESNRRSQTPWAPFESAAV